MGPLSWNDASSRNVRIFHSLTDRSVPELASVRPSGEKAQHSTPSLWPLSDLTSFLWGHPKL